jgi:hypothetical protein
MDHAASVLADAEVERVLNRGGGGCGADSAAQLAGALQEHLVSASHAMHAIVCQSIVDNAEYYHYIFGDSKNEEGEFDLEGWRGGDARAFTAHVLAARAVLGVPGVDCRH